MQRNTPFNAVPLVGVGRIVENPARHDELQAALRGSCEIVVGCVGLIRIAGNLGEYHHKDRAVSGIWAALSFSNAIRHSPGVLHAILFYRLARPTTLGARSAPAAKDVLEFVVGTKICDKK